MPRQLFPYIGGVSIHAFRGEGDYHNPNYRLQFRRVSIHAFRGEGDRDAGADRRRVDVSIHAFRGEGDWRVAEGLRVPGRFNPRLPGGRRHSSAIVILGGVYVSIHAFRGEGDK